MTKQLNKLKKEAAIKAVEFVEEGMVVGLGTGSTAAYAVEALAEKIKSGLKILSIATSKQTARQAELLGIKLTNFAAHRIIDLTIDGADEVELSSLNLIKGLGGALLKEKLVASVSKQLIIIVDETKPVNHLGERSPLPVEIVPFAWETTVERLQKLGASPNLRLSADKKPYITDCGNYILDCTFKPMPDPVELENKLNNTLGVVENGLFIKMTTTVVVAKSTGIDLLKRRVQ